MNENRSSQDTFEDRATNRRKVLRTLGSGAMLTSAIGGRAVAGDDAVELVVSRSPDGVHQTKAVPESWADHWTHAERVNDAAQSDWMSEPGIKTIGLSRSEQRYGGKPGFRIRVGVTDEFEGRLPESREGIPVEVVRESPVDYGGCGVTKDTNDIPGGVSMETSDDDGDCDQSFGTLGCKVSKDGSDYMMTACHIYGGGQDPCPSGISGGESAYHMGDYFGEVAEWDEEEDWLLLDTDDYETFDDQIWDPGAGERVDMVAWFTEAGVADLISTDELVRKIGVTLGREWGYVEQKSISSGWDCVDWDGEGVEVDIDFAQGDSGGPVWDKGDDGNGIMITHSCQLSGTKIDETDCHPISGCSSTSKVEDSLRGTAFYHLNDKYGIQVVDE